MANGTGLFPEMHPANPSLAGICWRVLPPPLKSNPWGI